MTFKVGDKVWVRGSDYSFNNTVAIVSKNNLDGTYKISHVCGYEDGAEFIIHPEKLSLWVDAESVSEPQQTKGSSDGGPSDYYDFPQNCTTLNDLIEYKNMSFAHGNIFKAAYRLGHKEGISLEYDLNKIIYYANRMLDQLRKKEGK